MISEKKDKRITIRFSENDYKYLACVACMAGMDISQYLRTLANASITALKVQEQKGAFNFENFEAVLNDKL